jgi:hypothetical protein
MKPTREIAAKVLEIVDCGLVQGVGEPTPGQMCVEAAVCYALGEPHGDEPSCVGPAVRRAKIRINDARWSSGTARAKGMRRVAIAQLGSDTLDQVEFSKRFTLAVIRELLPEALRRVGLMKEAEACAAAKDLSEARTASLSARSAAYAASAYAAADAAAYAADAAAYAADAAAYAADAATYAAADADAAAYAATYAAADAAAYAADAAAYAADAATYAAERDRVLTLATDIVERVLVEMKSPGAEWLDLAA